MQDWFYAQNGQQYGPITEGELQTLAETGQLRPDDLIWKDGMPEWVPAGETDGLFPDQRRATHYDAPPGAYSGEPRPARRAAYADDWDGERRPRGRAPAPSSNKGMLFGIIGGVVALLLVGGGVAYLLSNKSENNERTFSMRPGRTEKFNVRFERGKIVEINAKTTEGKHFDILVYDSRGRKVAGSESPTDECRVVFIPESTQSYRLRLKNLHHPGRNATMSGVLTWKIHEAKKFAKREHGNPPKIVTERSWSLETSEASSHYVRFQSGKTVEVSVRSNGQSDVDLFLYDETGRKIAQDIAMESHCRLVFSPPRTQTYKLQVVNRRLVPDEVRNGFNSGTVKWTLLGPGQQLAQGKIVEPPPPPLAVPNAQGVQAPPFTTRGLLTPASPRINVANNLFRYYRIYSVSLQKGRSYTIEMTAGFDTYLYLKDSTGRQLGSDDDGGPGLNARMIFRPLRSGVYRIYASSFSQRHHGPFTLTVR